MRTDLSPLDSVRVTLVGGPTAFIVLGGVRFLTDPTFDPPGVYEPRPGVTLVKPTGPAVAPEAIGDVDVVLLSHDHHKDNLDDAGREFLARVPRVLTTVSGAERLGEPATPLANWRSVEFDRPGGGTLRVTGLPAQHGPDGSEHLVGEVTGFLLTGEGLPSVYVSGDNASLDVVRADRRPGRPRRHRRPVRRRRADAVPGRRVPHASQRPAPSRAAQLLGARAVVPLHFDGWGHFSEGRDSLRTAFDAAGLLGRLVMPAPGEPTTVREGTRT